MSMKRILIVDDRKDVTTAVSQLMLQAGTHFEVTQYNDWMAAVEEIETAEPFDLIVTDFRMPRGWEGLAIVQAARAKSTGTKVIVMSSDMTTTDRQDSAADGYLVKPFRLETFILMIQSLVPDLEPRLA